MSCQWGVNPLPPETRLIYGQWRGFTSADTGNKPETDLAEAEGLSVNLKIATALIRDTARRTTNVDLLACVQCQAHIGLDSKTTSGAPSSMQSR